MLARLALCLLPVAAAAEVPPLGQVPRITEGIVAAGIAQEIADRCGPIETRRLAGISFLLGLQSHARSLGFSRAEIDAYVDDDAEKDRLEAIARERLAAMGAVPGDEASHCAVGGAEMAAGTQVGALLRD